MIYVFVTHGSVLDAARRRILSDMDGLGCGDFVIVCGSEKTSFEEESKTLFLECNDNYEGLPGKVTSALKYLVESERFSEYTHFAKLNGNSRINKLVDCRLLGRVEYGGHIIREEGNRRWHMGLCDPSSPFNFKPYAGKYVPWCDGGRGYVVSRKALESIKEMKPAEDQIYEDLCLSIMLKDAGVMPVDFDMMAYVSHSPLDIKAQETVESDSPIIVMPIFNRSDCLKECLESLAKTRIQGSQLIMVDDGSSDPNVKKLIDEFRMDGVGIQRIYKDRNVGMWDSYLLGFDWALENLPDSKTFVTLDSDTIHKPDWLERVTDLHRRMGECVVTGFNTRIHGIATEGEDYYEKHSAGGINFVLSKKMYFRVLRGVLERSKNGWDNVFNNVCRSRGIKTICTKPSVIQHIGRKGLNSPGNRWDHAEDF